MKEIEHIDFVNMNRLELWRDSIETIEALVRISMPHIIYIDLGISPNTQAKT